MEGLNVRLISDVCLVNTHIIFVAKVDAADLHLQVFDHLSGQFLHKGVLLLFLSFLCKKKQPCSFPYLCIFTSNVRNPVISFLFRLSEPMSRVSAAEFSQTQH